MVGWDRLGRPGDRSDASVGEYQHDSLIAARLVAPSHQGGAAVAADRSRRTDESVYGDPVGTRLYIDAGTCQPL